MPKPIYKTDQPVKRKRRRIGEMSDEMRRNLKSLTTWERINVECSNLVSQ